MISTVAEANSAPYCIHGVQLKDLVSHPDERGFFRELVRHNDPFFFTQGDTHRSFAQWSHSKMGRNTVKAWHFHHRQFDWWYCPIGLLEVVLYDLREESPSYKRKMVFRLGDEGSGGLLQAVVRIPPGVAHAGKVLSDTAHLFYITSETYDPQDEGRIPFDSKDIPHEWGEGVVVAQRDRVLHTPSYPRQKIR